MTHDAPELWAALLASTSVDQLPDVAALIGAPDWHTWAACRDEPVSTFFPTLGKQATAARKVCAVCPVFADCYSWALAQGDELAGIWAGTTAAQRRALRRHVA